MRLSRALKDKLFDVRLRDKFLEDGKIKKDQLNKYTESLPDDSDKFIFLKDEEKKEVVLEKKEDDPQFPPRI